MHVSNSSRLLFSIRCIMFFDMRSREIPLDQAESTGVEEEDEEEES